MHTGDGCAARLGPHSCMLLPVLVSLKASEGPLRDEVLPLDVGDEV